MLIVWSVLGAVPAGAEPAEVPSPGEASPSAELVPGSDQAIHAEVERIYGRSLPEAGVCIERPALGAPFLGDPTPVGVRRGSRGCVLLGIVVDGAWHEIEDALSVALPTGVWSGLSSDERTAALLAWTDAVSLAFDQPSGAASGAVTGTRSGAWVIARRMLRRDDRAGQSVESTARLTYDASLKLVSAEEEVHGRYLTTLFVRSDKLDGVPEAAVDRALTDHGRVVRQCFTDAWAADLALAGRVILSWDVSGGKVGTVAVITEEGTDEGLARCYARAVRAGSYPPEVSGSVRWVFGIERRTIRED